MIDPAAKRTSSRLAGVPRAQKRTYERNEFLFHAGAAADAGHLIQRGQVRCFLLDGEGRETTTAILGHGQFLGTDTLVGRDTHHEFCQALTRVEAWTLPADEVRQLLANAPAVQGWLLGSMAQRIALALALRRGISLLPAPERARDISLRLPLLSGSDPRGVRQAALAGLLQIRPETLARTHHCKRTVAQCADDPTTQRQQRLGVGRRAFDTGEVPGAGDLPCGCIGQVVSGCVEIWLQGSGSRALRVETLGPGDLFGFASLLALPPVSTRVVGISAGAIDVLSRHELLQQLRATAQCARLVIRLAGRLQVLEDELALAAVPDVGERLVQVLRQVASQNGHAAADGTLRIPASWSQLALAKQLGVCRETVTRGLAGLAKAGVIAREGRRIILVDRGDAGGRRSELCQFLPCEAPTPAGSADGRDARVVWLPTGSIDEPRTLRNSRRYYKETSIRELAASLRREGLLQPLCVRPSGSRYEVVFGLRRLRAAIQAGLAEVPCTIRDADDDRAFLLNAGENLHREQLSNVERVKTIERLAASGLGVREISRRTGFNPSTISRWLRINDRPELKQALEEDRIDIGRAVILVEAPASVLGGLIEKAPAMPAAELRRQVTALKVDPASGITYVADRRRLVEALRCLRGIHDGVNAPALIRSIRDELDRIAPG